MQTLYVSPTGNDSNPGTQTLPKKSPYGALDAVRLARQNASKDQFIIIFAPGKYMLDRTVSIGRPESGDSIGKPTILRGVAGQVFFDGSVKVTGWQLVSGPASNRLVPGARPNVFQAALPMVQGPGGPEVLDTGAMSRRGYPYETTQTWSTLVFNDLPMKIARHPNTGWMRVPDDHNGAPTSFKMTDPVPYGWQNTGDVWAHGFFRWDWADSFERVASFNQPTQTVTLATSPLYGIGPTQRYYLVNALEALDAPGEFFIDRTTSTAYFYVPLTGFTDAQKIASLNAGSFLTALDADLVETYDASDVVFERITFQNGRRGAVAVRFGARVEFKGCTFRRFNTLAAFVGSGIDHRFLSCDFYDLDEGAIQIMAGDRPSLTPARHEVVNCWLRDYGKECMSYRPGIDMWGVGNRVSNCKIEDAPHTGYIFHGNDLTIEFTDFARLCKETNDSGAVLIGRNPTFQGNKVHYNRFSDIKSYQIGTHSNFTVGVFLDDMSSGTEVAMNLFYDVQIGILIGGGRDNKVDNNFFFDTPKAIQMDGRGLSWAWNFWEEWGVDDMLAAVPYKSTLWRTRYPQLYNIVNDDPETPKRNDLTRSVHVGDTSWMTLYDDIVPVTNRRREYSLYSYFNSVTTGNPGFLDMANENYQFGPMSRLAWMKVKPIYPDQIGLYTDTYRTWLP